MISAGRHIKWLFNIEASPRTMWFFSDSLCWSIEIYRFLDTYLEGIILIRITKMSQRNSCALKKILGRIFVNGYFLWTFTIFFDSLLWLDNIKTLVINSWLCHFFFLQSFVFLLACGISLFSTERKKKKKKPESMLQYLHTLEWC